MRPDLNISTNSRRAAARPDPGLSLGLPNESLPRISESLTHVNPSLVLANESIALASHLPAFESHASITRANNSFTSVNESKTLVSEMTSSPAVRPGHRGTTPRKSHKTSHRLPKISRAFSSAHHIGSVNRDLQLNVPAEQYTRLMSAEKAPGIPIRLVLDLPRGSITLRVVVDDPAANRVGSLEIPVAVPN
jgi:hypothetical protein